MESSLIGKAVGFGPNECGFESHVSNIFYNNYAYVINHYNLVSSKKCLWGAMVLNRQTMQLTKKLHQIGAISTFVIITRPQDNKNFWIKFSVTMFRNEPFFSKIKLVSKPSRSYSTKLKHLAIIKKKSRQTSILLLTSAGILTMDEALSRRISGKIFCVLT